MLIKKTEHWFQVRWVCCSIGRPRHGTDQRRPSLTWCQLLMRRGVPRWGRDGSIFSFKHLWHTYDERPLWQLKRYTSDHMFITKPAGIQSRLPQRPFPRSMSSEVQVYEEQRVGVGIQCLARNCGILFLVFWSFQSYSRYGIHMLILSPLTGPYDLVAI